MVDNVDTIDLTYDSKTKEIIFEYGLTETSEIEGTKIKKVTSTEQRYPSIKIDELMKSVRDNIKQNKKLIEEFKERLDKLKEIQIEIKRQS